MKSKPILKTRHINCIVCEEPIAIINEATSIIVTDCAVCSDCLETKNIEYILKVLKER